MEEWPASASEPIPSKTPKEKQPCYPPPGQTNPRLHLEFLLPLKNAVLWEPQVAAVRSSRWILKEDKESESLPFLCLNLPAHNSVSSRVSSFPANPILFQARLAGLHLPLLNLCPGLGKSIIRSASLSTRAPPLTSPVSSQHCAGINLGEMGDKSVNSKVYLGKDTLAEPQPHRPEGMAVGFKLLIVLIPPEAPFPAQRSHSPLCDPLTKLLMALERTWVVCLVAPMPSLLGQCDLLWLRPRCHI